MISLTDIRRAAERIHGYIIRTPLIYSPTISTLCKAHVYLKLETMQRAGSFKIRGAMNKVLSVREGAGVHGVITASAGNHAQGVAVAARTAGLKATIVMPEGASLSKQEATRGYGAQVILHGRDVGESLEYARYIAKEGEVFIHPYDDEDVIAGQGTIALEILEDISAPDLVLVPVGGGGLIGGISVGIKQEHPTVRVVGVQSAACPAIFQAYYQRDRVECPPSPSLADGIMVTESGERTIPLIRNYVDGMVLVTEEQIADAMLLLLERKKVIAEGAGAAPLAALMGGSVPVKPQSTVVLVISGGNVDSTILERVIRRGQIQQGRIMRISVVLKDVPGSLASLLSTIAQTGGNILQIHHIQGSNLPIFSIQVDLEVEIRGIEHKREITNRLEKEGYLLLIRDW